MAGMKKDGLAPPPATRAWTRIDDYLVHMRRRDAAARRRRRLEPRTEPEAPRFMLSTFPFAALLAVFAFMTIVILITAWPGRERSAPSRPAMHAVHEVGTAAKGWFQEAQRDMH
jgi:hypothetical protein